jgi:two-component system response regulator
VEDSPDDEALTLRALRRNHIQNPVVVAHDGVEALAYLLPPASHAHGEAPRDMPALILLDLKLPKVDGLEVLRRLRADDRTRLIPVVILSSSREDQDLIAGYSLGCNGYVRKPVDFGEFTNAIRHLGLYWLVVNEPPPMMPPSSLPAPHMGRAEEKGRGGEGSVRGGRARGGT